ncbi:MAG TPA: hypothetical protein VK464_16170 [Symbiobacteriaceae bacterium]|jgi:hypothetical protein|nr:hypothetical protein [Symbiobacteriaceae bacterium]
MPQPPLNPQPLPTKATTATVSYEQLARLILPLIIERLEREKEVRLDGR